MNTGVLCQYAQELKGITTARVNFFVLGEAMMDNYHAKNSGF